MTVYMLVKRLWFPEPDKADESGLLAVGGDLRPERLILAYRTGVFPWYSEEEPILWWSPEPRFVLVPDEFKLRRSLRKVIRSGRYQVRFDTRFADVIEYCSNRERPGQDGTWITADMKKAYEELHKRGVAHSIETYQGDELVGGLYGVAIGSLFFGESMFHLAPDASKVALAALVARYRTAPLIDCQVHNDFFESMGARHMPRREFLKVLKKHIDDPNLWEAGVGESFTEPGPIDNI